MSDMASERVLSAQRCKKDRPKILFFITEDWFFCSHFLDRAIAAVKHGYRVVVVARVRKHSETINSAGLGLIPFEIKRRRVNPLREIRMIGKLVQIYKSEQPDIVHQIALKPILYGTLAARLARVPMIVNAPVGMGFVFSSARPLARLLRPFITLAYRILLNPVNSFVIVENHDDLEMLAKTGLVRRERTKLIRGAGVNLNRFTSTPEPEGDLVVVLASRMLWDKGVGEFVEAASRLKADGVKARFVLVGQSDPENPAAIDESQLRAWDAAGNVEWWGHRDDMPSIFAGCHIVCLPSYREGLPKSLIEAAACGRPIVATDVPGCREIVRPDENGLLVKSKDPKSLADALRKLIEDPSLRKRMGVKGRQIAEAEFSVADVSRETLRVYDGLIAGHPA